MGFTSRPTTPADFDSCLTLIRDGFVHGDAAKASLLHFWDEILARGLGRSSVIEDEERAGTRAVGFGLSIFVRDEFVKEAKTMLAPYVSQHVLERWLHGRAPLLTPEGVRRANSRDGLNVLILHYGFKPGLSAEEFIGVRQMLMEAFMVYHRGYRLKEVLEEVYGLSDLQPLLRSGLVLRTDYARFFRRRFPPRLLPDLHPYLVGLTREEAFMGGLGSFASQLFLFTPPHFHLTSAEQDLLQRALQGDTDEELAHVLRIALVTVKKRWEAIYGRIAAVDPRFFNPAALEQGKRGVEKRRRLLVYLRQHPEELRPSLPIKSPKFAHPSPEPRLLLSSPPHDREVP